MTILRNDCLCFLLRFWKMSQLSSCRSLKPTARWWFSSTDESLYIRASSESEGKKGQKKVHRQHCKPPQCITNHILHGHVFIGTSSMLLHTIGAHVRSHNPCGAMPTHWCWWETDWKLQGDPHHGWRWQTEQRGSPDQWTQPWTHTKRQGQSKCVCLCVYVQL